MARRNRSSSGAAAAAPEKPAAAAAPDKPAAAAAPDKPAASDGAKDKAKVVKAIVAAPTASDAQIAAETGVDSATVMAVRSGMGAKHTWPKAKD